MTRPERALIQRRQHELRRFSPTNHLEEAYFGQLEGDVAIPDGAPRHPPREIDVPLDQAIEGFLITAPGPLGGPDVRLYKYAFQPTLRFNAYDPSFLGGVFVG